MKQIQIDKEKCIGCGACVAIAPENFEFDDEGKSSVLSNENIESENITNAIESCPTSAISLTETDGKCNCKECECDNCECDDCNCEECECGDECNCGEECTCPHCHEEN